MARKIRIRARAAPLKTERAKELRRIMTQAEKALWPHLKANKLRGLHFRRQQVIEGFIVDFYCHSAGVVIELDGGIHEHRREYDDARDAVFSSMGLTVLRYPNAWVFTGLHRMLDEIANACMVDREKP